MILADTICSNAGEVWSKYVDGSWQDKRAEGVSCIDYIIKDVFARIGLNHQRCYWG